MVRSRPMTSPSRDHHSLANYISDTRGLLIKNFPEFHACAHANSAQFWRNSGAILAQ